MKRKAKSRSSRSTLRRQTFSPDIAEACEQMEQAVVTYEEAARMYDQCCQDMMKLKARMQKASRLARNIPLSHDELLRFAGLRVDAVYVSE